MNNDSIDQWMKQALDFQRSGRSAQAAVAFEHVLALSPRHAHALNGLGAIALQGARFQEAANFFQQAHAADPSNPGFLMNLGTAMLRQRRFKEAEEAYRTILSRSPDDPSAMSNLAIVLAETGQTAQAVDLCRRALAINPQLISAYLNLGAIHRKSGQYAQAAQAFSKALELAPGRPDLLTHLGVCLGRMGQTDRAIELHRQSIAAAPRFSGAFNNLGITLHGALRLQEAIATYGQGLAIAPEDPNLHMNLGLSLLLGGQWEQGFVQYEWRLRNPEFYDPQYLRRRWDGSNPAGKTILLRCEQGIGDTFQFVRYAKLLADRGASVLVEVHPLAASIVARAPGVQTVIPQGQTLPQFDFQIPILSLPLAFNTRIDSVPADIPYLDADPGKIQEWAQRFRQYPVGVKVGLVWAGSAENPNDAVRSMKLTQLAPLAAVPGIRWFSLQKSQAAMQVFQAPPRMELIDLAPFLNGFEETAAAIANLDLVISVDTAVAHLAGAMGRPIWNLLQFAPDWRWLLNRKDTPWYPTMRLFRQPAPADWNSVVAEVVMALAEFARDGR